MIKVNNISKTYPKSEYAALDNINLQFAKNGLVAIVGPSGCGKTTLLNLIGGLDSPTSGSITVNDKIITDLSRHELDAWRYENVGYIFQDFVLIEQKTVYENLEMFCSEEDENLKRQMIVDALKSVRLDSLIDRKINKLSGGEQQRVAIARAIIKNPTFLLADEPTGNLDEGNRILVMEILKKLSEHYLVIMVTHEEELAKNYANRMIKINDGVIIQDIFISKEKVDIKPVSNKPNNNTFHDKKYFSFHNKERKSLKILLIILVVLFNIVFSLLLGITIDTINPPFEASNYFAWEVYENNKSPFTKDDVTKLFEETIFSPLNYRDFVNLTLGLSFNGPRLPSSQLGTLYHDSKACLMPETFFDYEPILGIKPQKVDEVLIDISIIKQILNGSAVSKHPDVGQVLSFVRKPEDFIGATVTSPSQEGRFAFTITGIVDLKTPILLASKEYFYVGDSSLDYQNTYTFGSFPMYLFKQMISFEIEDLNDDTVYMEGYYIGDEPFKKGSRVATIGKHQYNVIEINHNLWNSIFFTKSPQCIMNDYVFVKTLIETRGHLTFISEDIDGLQSKLAPYQMNLIKPVYKINNTEESKEFLKNTLIVLAILIITFLLVYFIDVKNYYILNLKHVIPFITLGVSTKLLVDNMVKERMKQLFVTLCISEFIAILLLVHFKSYNDFTSHFLSINILPMLLGLGIPLLVMWSILKLYLKIKFSKTPYELKTSSK